MGDYIPPYRFIYEPSEYQRIIFAVNIDARATIPVLVNAIGDVIKAYCDTEVNKVKATPQVLFFRIESVQGVLAGYFSLFVKGQSNSARLYQFVLRPAFVQFNTQITNEITNFITSNEWKQFFL